MDHGHLILLSTLCNNIVIMMILTLYGYELIIIVIIRIWWLWTSSIQKCLWSGQKVCKGVLAFRSGQSSIQDVAKMCTNVHKLYTPSMTTLDTLLGNWVHFPSSFQVAHRQYSNLCTTWIRTCTREFPSCTQPTFVLCLVLSPSIILLLTIQSESNVF